MTDSKPSLAPKRLVILVSGGGSHLQSFIDGCASGEINATVSAVISNNPDAGGLERAAKAGIPNLAIDHRAFDSREAFDQALSELIDSFSPDLVILAGFMRILTPVFINRFLGKLVNIHPSLLPKYSGLNTHQRAIDAGDKEAGSTVHYVTNELDGGPAILQARVNIANTDDAQTLACKVLEVEHLIFPEAVNWHLQGRVVHADQGAQLDGELLPPTGAQWKNHRGE